CSYGNGHVVITGHPRAEIDHTAFNNPHGEAIAKARGRLVIAWTPHFSVFTRRRWSSFLDYHEVIFRLFDRRPNLFLLIRPHPLLRSSLATVDGWSDEKVTEWFNSADKRENVHVDIEADYRPAFSASDALMTDAGSFLVEYLHTGKPICYLQGNADIGLTEEVRQLSCFYPGKTEADITRFLDIVENKTDEMQYLRSRALKSYYNPGKVPPSQAILENIAVGIEDPPARTYTSRAPTTALHEKAFQYWIEAATTFLTPENYCREQEAQLRQLL